MNLKVPHHEITQYSADLESFGYYPQEWSLLPTAIKQFRPSIALTSLKLGKAHICRSGSETIMFLCFAE